MKNFNILYRHRYNSRHYIDPAQRNYTITGLQPDTHYYFSVQAVNWNVESSPYTEYVSATTLPPGRCLTNS